VVLHLSRLAHPGCRTVHGDMVMKDPEETYNLCRMQLSLATEERDQARRELRQAREDLERVTTLSEARARLIVDLRAALVEAAA
jgi:hypothetical protein